MDERERALEVLLRQLHGRATADAEQDVGDPLDQRLEESLSLSRHGEGGVAVENLCENLYEYDVRLTRDEHARLVELARLWGVQGSTADTLALLYPDDDDGSSE